MKKINNCLILLITFVFIIIITCLTNHTFEGLKNDPNPPCSINSDNLTKIDFTKPITGKLSDYYKLPSVQKNCNMIKKFSLDDSSAFCTSQFNNYFNCKKFNVDQKLRNLLTCDKLLPYQTYKLKKKPDDNVFYTTSIF